MTGRLDRYTTYVVLVGFSLLALYPMISILFLAFHNKNDLVTASRSRRRSASTRSPPPGDGGFAQGMWGSFLVAASVTVVSAVLSLLTGYAFGTMRFLGSGAALQPDRGRVDLPLRGDGHPALLRLPRLPPGGTPGGAYWALILPQIGQSVTLGTFWMRAFFLARRARSSRRRASTAPARFAHPPQRAAAAAKPRCSRSGVLVFMYTWNEFLLALVCSTGRTTRPRRSGSRSSPARTRATDPTKVAAAAVLVALPVLIVYLFLQRHFIRGVLAGAIKE